MNKIIIFDCDGVILDSLNIFMKCFVSACEKLGYYQISSKQSFLDLFDDNFYKCITKMGIKQNDIPKILKNFETNIIQSKKKVPLFDGIKDVINQLATKNKIYIITSNLSNIIKNLLTSYKINVFEEIIGAEKETSKIKKIESIKKDFPNHIFFYIGDTKGDMIEGNLSGAHTIAVLWGWHNATKLKEGSPDFIANKPQELINIINNYK
jgi:phosphoglycolate phosphatase